jgi:chromate reductase
MKVIAVSGSLRKASTNTGLLKSALKLSPSGLNISLFSISDFPMYNDDLCVPSKPKIILDAYN